MKKIKKSGLILTTIVALLAIVSCSNYVDQSSNENTNLINNESKTSQTNQDEENDPQSRYCYSGSYSSSTGGSSSYSSGGH